MNGGQVSEALRGFEFSFAFLWFERSKKEDVRRSACLGCFLPEGNTKRFSEFVASVFPARVFLADLRSLSPTSHPDVPGTLFPRTICSPSMRTGLGLVSSLDNAHRPQTGQALHGCKLLEMHLVFI